MTWGQYPAASDGGMAMDRARNGLIGLLLLCIVAGAATARDLPKGLGTDEAKEKELAA